MHKLVRPRGRTQPRRDDRQPSLPTPRPHLWGETPQLHTPGPRRRQCAPIRRGLKAVRPRLRLRALRLDPAPGLGVARTRPETGKTDRVTPLTGPAPSGMTGPRSPERRRRLPSRCCTPPLPGRGLDRLTGGHPLGAGRLGVPAFDLTAFGLHPGRIRRGSHSHLRDAQRPTRRRVIVTAGRHKYCSRRSCGLAMDGRPVMTGAGRRERTATRRPGFEQGLGDTLDGGWPSPQFAHFRTDECV